VADTAEEAHKGEEVGGHPHRAYPHHLHLHTLYTLFHLNYFQYSACPGSKLMYLVPTGIYICIGKQRESIANIIWEIGRRCEDKGKIRTGKIQGKNKKER
jgi:hypothetical protein